MKFIFTMLFNVWFYVGMVGIVLVIYLFPGLSIGSRELPDLSLFHFATSTATEKIYVPKRTISNVIIGVTYANISIGNKQHKQTGGKDVDFDNDFEAMVYTKSSIASLLNRDFIQMMDNSTDKRKTLQSFINELTSTLQQADEIYSTASSKVTDRQLQYDSCTSNKEITDAAYVTAISQEDVRGIEQLLKQAEEYAQCQTNLRIKINSYVLPLQDLKTAREAAAAYLLVLNERFETLVQYYDIMRDDLLLQLLETKQTFGL